MATLPWVSNAEPSPEGQYLFLISYLPLKRYSALPRFAALHPQNPRPVGRDSGAGRLLAARQPAGKGVWTLSVWEDHEALTNFAQEPPDGRVVPALLPHMGETKFFHWHNSGSAVPPDWRGVTREAAKIPGPPGDRLTTGSAPRSR